MERKLRQVVLDWKRSENKNEVIKNLYTLLFKQKEQVVVNKLAKKVDNKYREIAETITVGTMVKSKKNYQVGTVHELRGKRAIVLIGQLPMNVDLADLVPVEKIPETPANL